MNGNNCKIGIITKVTQRYSGARFQIGLLNDCLRNVETDGYTEKGSICETKIFDNPLTELEIVRWGVKAMGVTDPL